MAIFTLAFLAFIAIGYLGAAEAYSGEDFEKDRKAERRRKHRERGQSKKYPGIPGRWK